MDAWRRILIHRRTPKKTVILYVEIAKNCNLAGNISNLHAKWHQSSESRANAIKKPPKMNATEQAYQIIRKDILTGRLAEGERLTIEGFIDRQKGYTTCVAYFPQDEVEQIYEIRRLVECYSVERAARLAIEEDIAELRRIHAAMREDTPPRDKEAYHRLTEAFHRAIVGAARSPRLTTLMTTALDVSMVVRTYSMFSEKDLLRSLNHHEEIIQAIEARAPKWASSVMSAHLLSGATRVAERTAKTEAERES